MNEQHTPAPESTPAGPETQRGRTRPRTGPIIWGVIFLACCAWISQRVFFPSVISPEIWITAIVLGIGVVLLAVGVTVVLRRR